MKVAGTAATLTGVGVSGPTVTLTLDTAVTATETVTVSYAEPAGDDTFYIEDLLENDAVSFTDEAVTNNVAAAGITAVELTSDANDDGRPGNDSAYAIGDTVEVTVTFTEAVTVSGTPRLPLVFDRYGGTAAAEYASGNNSMELVFEYEVAEGDSEIQGISIGANVLALDGGAIRAQSGSADAVLTHAAVGVDGSHRVDGVRPRPVFDISHINAGRLELLFTDTLDRGSVPDGSAFEVTVNGEARAESVDSMRGLRLIVTVSPGAGVGDEVDVSYTPPAQNPVRDRVGNTAEAFAWEDVRNFTPARTPDAPTNLGAVEGNAAATLAWTKPRYDGGSAITKHQYRYRTTGGYGGWQEIADSGEGGANETGYTVTGLANDVAHVFQVRAYNEVDGGSAGEASNEATVTPVAGIAVSFASATGSATEDEESVEVEVRLSVAPAAALTVPLTATRGAGLEADEYTGVPGSVTIAANATSTSFDMMFVADTVDESDETLTLGFGTLPEGYVEGMRSKMRVTVLDDDYPEITASLAAAQTSAPEGSQVAVTVRLSAAPQREITVALAVTPGPGLGADDYALAPENVDFAADETAQPVTMTFTDDDAEEPDETLTLGFGSLPANVSAGTKPTLTFTIEDDDGPPGAPGNLAATAGDGSVRLSWSEPVQNDSPVLPGPRRRRDLAGRGSCDHPPV